MWAVSFFFFSHGVDNFLPSLSVMPCFPCAGSFCERWGICEWTRLSCILVEAFQQIRFLLQNSISLYDCALGNMDSIIVYILWDMWWGNSLGFLGEKNWATPFITKSQTKLQILIKGYFRLARFISSIQSRCRMRLWENIPLFF